MHDEPELPRPGQSVEMHEADGRSSLGRVQSVSNGSVTIAIPADAAIAVTAEDGERLELRWPDGQHAGVLPVTLTGRAGSTGLQLWEVVPAGPVTFAQRRQQHRTAAGGPIALTVYTASAEPPAPDAASAVPTVTGSLVDISDAALQCLVPTDASNAVIVSGTVVLCDFSLYGARYRLRGAVHAAWTADAQASVRVVVRFDPGQADLAALHAALAA